jgi:uncharacterized protein involved in copper resistance
VGAEVLFHYGRRGPAFRDEKSQWLVGINDVKSAYANVQRSSAWECCAETGTGMERVGLLADGDVLAVPFARVESWKW